MLFNVVSKSQYFLRELWLFLLLDLLFICFFLLISIQLSKSKINAMVKKLAIAFISLILAGVFLFSLFEAYYRFIYDVPDGLGFLKVSKKWEERHVTLSEYNKYYFRDKPITLKKKEGVTRIGVIGDSISYGAGIENVNTRFSNLLEKKLADSGYKAEVYNLGIPGYDTDEELKLYRNLRHLNFDVIIWQYFLNDIQPEEASTGTQIIVNNRAKSPFFEQMSNKSYFLDFLYWKFSLKYKKTLQELKFADLNQYKNDDVLAGHKTNLNTLVDELQAENKKILVVIFPSTALIQNGQYSAAFAHDIVKEVFSKRNVITIDLLPDLIGQDKERLFASSTDSHPSEFVHGLAAEKIYKELLPLLE